MFFLQQFHEIMEQLNVHFLSDNVSFRPFFIDLFQCEYLFSLELIQIDVDAWSLDGFSLAEISLFKVVVLNDLFRMPGCINEIMNAMTKGTIICVKKAKTSEIITTE
jgi:hypothetical protein